jgi:hypothetical protein
MPNSAQRGGAVVVVLSRAVGTAEEKFEACSMLFYDEGQRGEVV